MIGDHFTTGGEHNNWVRNDELPEPDENTIHLCMDTRDEQGMIVGQKLAETQDKRKPNPTHGYRGPKVGDLVLVRDIQLAKEEGKKLEARWSTP